MMQNESRGTPLLLKRSRQYQHHIDPIQMSKKRHPPLRRQEEKQVHKEKDSPSARRVELTTLIAGVYPAKVAGVDAPRDLADLLAGLGGVVHDKLGVGEPVGGELALGGFVPASLGSAWRWASVVEQAYVARRER